MDNSYLEVRISIKTNVFQPSQLLRSDQILLEHPETKMVPEKGQALEKTDSLLFQRIRSRYMNLKIRDFLPESPGACIGV